MAEMEKGEFCTECPAWSLPAVCPAVVQLAGDGETWMLVDEGTPVHIAALFRDPGIADERPVKVVLDLHLGQDGRLEAGRRCWVGEFLGALQGLPVGITVALDNGVRCPTPTKEGFEVYKKRAKHCHGRSGQWFSTLQHPDGKAPGIAICDKDLACSLAELGLLQNCSGGAWREPARFVDAVGDEVTYRVTYRGVNAVVNAVVLAHPVVFSRHAGVYRQAFAAKGIVSRLTQLARLEG
jgi:hypothetical protein